MAERASGLERHKTREHYSHTDAKRIWQYFIYTTAKSKSTILEGIQA